MKKRGKFIVFEGIDGSGKSTQVKKLAEYLKSKKDKTYTTFEPTSSPVGSILRNILTHRIKASEQTIAALFLADRLDHIQNEVNGILKMLDNGFHVICDRYYFSSYAYHVPHVSLDWVIEANSVAAKLLRPDINLYIDITVEESLRRIQANRATTDLFETKERITTVRKNYLEAFERLKHIEKIKIINGAQSVDAVFEEVKLAVEDLVF